MDGTGTSGLGYTTSRREVGITITRTVFGAIITNNGFRGILLTHLGLRKIRKGCDSIPLNVNFFFKKCHYLIRFLDSDHTKLRTESMSKFIIIIFFFSIFFFSSCTPRKFLIEVYSSDFEAVNEGEIIQIPATVEFSIMLKDKDEMIELAKQKTLPFLSEDSSMELNKATIGETLTIKTEFPLGKKRVLQEKETEALFHVVVDDDRVFVEPTAILGKLNKSLKEISFALYVDFPPTKTIFRIISDSRKELNLSATAAFSDNKAYLEFKKSLKRRDSIEVEFRGDDGSIYSEITPFLKYSFE